MRSYQNTGEVIFKILQFPILWSCTGGMSMCVSTSIKKVRRSNLNYIEIVISQSSKILQSKVKNVSRQKIDFRQHNELSSLCFKWYRVSKWEVHVFVVNGYFKTFRGTVVVVIVWWLDLQLPMPLMLITTKFSCGSNPAHGEVKSI